MLMSIKKVIALSFLLTLFLPAFMFAKLKEKPMVVVICSYNNADWYKMNLDSVFAQKYSNFRVIYVDDNSPDNTGELVANYLKGKKNIVTLIINGQRKGSPIANQYMAITEYTDDDEIIVILDGDDWFSDPYVLKRINKEYVKKDVWLTHGTLLEWPHKRLGWSIPIPEEVVASNTFRSFRCPSHTRTFYSWLFKMIKKEDLMYEGEFCPMAGDMAQMYPMIEMAGERHSFINQVTYIYNMKSGLNENKVNPQLQRDIDAHIRARPPYRRLENRPIYQ